jgi:phosphate-selective porin OprO/OprP
LSPFFVSRGIGLRLSKPFAHDSMTYSAGWFNDWFVQDQSFGESGNDFVGRLTAVPYWKNGGADYVHLGISGRYIGADAGTLRFRGRPENNVTSYYVDSGSMAGNQGNEVDVESLWSRGPMLVAVDAARASVDARDSGNPVFWGAYIVASYVVTGEHRPYDKTIGYARRIVPLSKWGAWEIVGRYAHVDIANQKIDGGVFDRETVGLSWWATRRWRLSVDYGFIDLDRAGINGITDAVHTRLQWIY